MKSMKEIDEEKKRLLACVAGIFAAVVGVLVVILFFGAPNDRLAWSAFIIFAAGFFAIAYLAALAVLNDVKVGAAVEDFFKYTIGYTLHIFFYREAEARPLFNLKITREYDGLIDWKTKFPYFFEANIEHWQKSIMAARRIIGENVHVDKKGRIWPHHLEGLPVRKASLNIVEERAHLLIMWNAFQKEEKLTQYERVPHIHVDADKAAGLRAEIYQIYFDGRRAYLYEIDREATSAKELRRFLRKFA